MPIDVTQYTSKRVEFTAYSMQAEAELPVTAVPESPEANENNPFLSGLQQSGISMTTGKV